MTSAADTAPPAGEISLRQGWQVVGAATLAHFVPVAATLACFGVMIEPVARDFGVGVAMIGLGNGLLMGVSGLCSAWIGPHLDRMSIRALMMVGGGLLWAGLLGVSRSHELWVAGLFFSGVAGVGFTLMGALPGATLLAKWFHRQRGRALGIASTGSTLASLAIPPLASWWVVEIGWRDTLAWLAWGGLLVLPLVFHGARNPPQRSSAAGLDGSPQASVSRYTTRQLLGMRDFWVVAGIFGLAFASGTVMMVFLVPYGIALGIEPAWAGWLLTLRGCFGIVGRLVAGSLADRWHLRSLLWAVTAAQSALWLVMIGKPDLPVLLLTVMGLGLTGAFFPISNATTARVFGSDAYGQVAGLLNLVRLPFGLLAIPAAGYMRDVSGSYTLPFQVFLCGLALTAILTAFLREPSRSETLSRRSTHDPTPRKGAAS